MLTSQLLQTTHGMFTRKNGHSPHPYSSLNLSLGVGDSRENVLNNRQKIKDTLAIDILVSAQQVHSDKICQVDDITEDTEFNGFDALITNTPGIGLLIQQADCQAILLHDPVRRAAGAIHCGWKGSILNIIRLTVGRMTEAYGSNPAAILAIISPSLGPCCAEFTHYRTEIPGHLHDYQIKPGFFDFWKMSKDQLIDAGLQEKNIDIASICTLCNRDFFSFRRSTKQGNRITGRHGSVISLDAVRDKKE